MSVMLPLFILTVIIFISYCHYCYHVISEEYIHVTTKDVNTAMKKEQVHEQINILV